MRNPTTNPVVVPPIITGPLPNPVVINPPPSQLSTPTVQLATSAAGLTNLNNSSPATAPQFDVSGLVALPGVTVQVIVYSDGTQIGQATATGSSVVVTANGTAKLSDGTHQITAVESEKGGAIVMATKAETIKVSTVAPRITSKPVTQAAAGSTMNYQVTTNAAAGEKLTYLLVTAPAGMAISSSGKISWNPPIGTTGTQRVDVRVTDPYGNFSDQTFSIALYEPFGSMSLTGKVLGTNGAAWWE